MPEFVNVLLSLFVLLLLSLQPTCLVKSFRLSQLKSNNNRSCHHQKQKQAAPIKKCCQENITLSNTTTLKNQQPQASYNLIDTSFFISSDGSLLTKNKNSWTRLLPPPLLLLSPRNDNNNNNNNDYFKPIDVSIEWENDNHCCKNNNDNNTNTARETATFLVQECFGQTRIFQKDIEYLTKILSTFQDYCNTHLQPNPDKFKIRIVASRGLKESAKCPQWHYDHVPIRWIQSLVGPGCEIVTNDDAINWDVMNGLDDDDDDSTKDQIIVDSFRDRNDLLINKEMAHTYKVKEQEVALLKGKTWNEYCANEKYKILPVIHKSPSSILPWQGRVLVTQDVIYENDNDYIIMN